MTKAEVKRSTMKKLLRRIVERPGDRYFKIAYQPVELDHAHDVARFPRRKANAVDIATHAVATRMRRYSKST